MEKFKEFDDLFSEHPGKESDDRNLFTQGAPKEVQKKKEEEALAESDQPWKILVVDDEEDVHSVTQMALKGFRYQERGVLFFDAYSAEEARQILHDHPDIALILLDVVMETNQAGLELVKYIRENLGNHGTCIILRTGQPGQAPEKEVIVNYEINDYKTKTELTSFKLFTVALAGFRAYNSIRQAEEVNRRLQLEIKERIRIEKDLVAARKHAEESEKVKTEFLNQLTGEIKTPLDIILNSTTHIKEKIQDKITEDIREMFDKMNYSGKRIIRTIQLIIDLSEINAGNYILKRIKVDVKSMVEEILQEARPGIMGKEVQVKTRFVTDNTTLNADSYSVRQILMNLVDNAFKFTEKGSVELNLFRDKKNCLVFEITDTGHGMGPDYLEKLYTPFSQEEMPGMKKSDGIGLGLALTQAYCSMNHYTLEADSKKGKGTMFRVTFREQ
jgi:signal transduction histidine kinase